MANDNGQRPFRFMDLPRELRNKVYDAAWRQTSPMKILFRGFRFGLVYDGHQNDTTAGESTIVQQASSNNTNSSTSQNQITLAVFPALLLTSKQIYREARQQLHLHCSLSWDASTETRRALPEGFMSDWQASFGHLQPKPYTLLPSAFTGITIECTYLRHIRGWNGSPDYLHVSPKDSVLLFHLIDVMESHKIKSLSVILLVPYMAPLVQGNVTLDLTALGIFSSQPLEKLDVSVTFRRQDWRDPSYPVSTAPLDFTMAAFRSIVRTEVARIGKVLVDTQAEERVEVDVGDVPDARLTDGLDMLTYRFVKDDGGGNRGNGE